MTSNLDIVRRAAVSDFLAKAHLARLATCNPNTLQPHVVPVWYEWDGEFIWISSFRSTRKVREIEQNPLVSLAIDIPSEDNQAPGVLFEGTAELITDPALGVERGTRIYTRYLGPQGVLEPEPQSWLHDPEHLIIRLDPQRVYVWGIS
jgi:PPOX class probable F420-dependent enzyme